MNAYFRHTPSSVAPFPPCSFCCRADRPGPDAFSSFSLWVCPTAFAIPNAVDRPRHPVRCHSRERFEMGSISLRNLGVTANAPLFARPQPHHPATAIGSALVAGNGHGKTTLLRFIAGRMASRRRRDRPGRGASTLGYVEQDVPEALMDSPSEAPCRGAARRAAHERRLAGRGRAREFEMPEELRDRPLRNTERRLAAADADRPRLDDGRRYAVARRADQPSRSRARSSSSRTGSTALPRDMPVIIASHDRAFLDATTNRTLFLRPERPAISHCPIRRRATPSRRGRRSGRAALARTAT